MTASPRRRRRSTVLAAVAAVVGVALVGGLGAIGAVTLYHSTEGADAATKIPELRFPSTPTVLLAGVDADARLASLTVVVARPNGTGGSIVSVPVAADATAGEGDTRLPIAETAATEGIEAVAREAEVLLSLSFDAVEVADAARLASLLEPIGPVEVELPDDVTDAGGDVVVDAGHQSLDAATMAAVLTARDPDVDAVDQLAAAGAVWSGVAAAIGDGGGDAPTTTTASARGSITVDGMLAQVRAGPARHRTLSSAPVDAERNPDDLDVVLLDRVELAMIFGQIAPGRVSAPNPSLTFRVVSSFSEAQLAGSGLTSTEVAERAVAQLLFLRGNVLSVDTATGTAPASTIIELSDDSLVSGTDGAEELFGEIDVAVGESRIVGIDAVVRLGTAYLVFLAAAEAQDG